MSRNPVLNDKAFTATTAATGPSPAQEWEDAKRSGAGPRSTGVPHRVTPAGRHEPLPAAGPAMSLGGVASATLVLFAVLLVGSWWGWSQVSETAVALPGPGQPDVVAELASPVVFYAALGVGFLLAIVTVAAPRAARFTAVPYALVQGAVLGMVSHLYDAELDGIVVQAVLATLGVLFAMLALYGLRVLRATPRFVKGVVAATFGVVVVYLGSFLFSLFTGNRVSFLHDATPLGIGISVVVVVIAALNLILDFDFIERGVQNRLPRHMDWYAAFGLAVTLIWLYLEMLRLLAKLRR